MTDQEKIKYINEDVDAEIHKCKNDIKVFELEIQRLETKVERLREAVQLAERLQGRLQSYNDE